MACHEPETNPLCTLRSNIAGCYGLVLFVLAVVVQLCAAACAEHDLCQLVMIQKWHSVMHVKK